MALFAVPARLADLADPDRAGWKPQTLYQDPNENKVTDKIENAIELVQDDPTQFANHQAVDPALAVLMHFQQANQYAKAKAHELILNALRAAVKATKSSLAAMAPDAELTRLRETLSMAVFLHSSFIHEAEKHAAKKGEADVRGRKGVRTDIFAESEESWNWAHKREQAVLALVDAIQLDLPKLWGLRAPEEEFILCFIHAASSVLEQPKAMRGATSSFKEALWRLIAIPSVTYEQEIASASSVVNLLLTHEHLASPLSELMVHLLEEHQAARIVGGILRELATMPADMGADSLGTKNVAQFITSLASRAPLMLIANLEILTDVLASDSYALRCGVVSAVGQLHIAVSGMKPAPPPEVAEAAQDLIEIPLSRVHDTSAFVRLRAVHTLAAMCEARSVSMMELHRIAQVGLKRINDKNANVRRGGMQLFGALLEFNPFGSSLDRKALEERREMLCSSLPPQISATACADDPPSTGKKDMEDAEGSPTAKSPDMKGTTTKSPDAAAKSPATQSPVTNEVSPERRALELLDQALALEAELSVHVSTIQQLLGSQTNSDVLESLNALVVAHCFELNGVRPAVILNLIWSRETSVKAAVLNAAQAIWLRPQRPGESQSGAAHSLGVARGLCQLTATCTLAELTSLEETLSEWHSQQMLPAYLFTVLWDTVQAQRPEVLDIDGSRAAALSLLNMAASNDPKVLRCKMDVIMQQMRGSRVDVNLARQACAAMLRCTSAGPIGSKTAVSLLHSLDELLLRRPSSAQADAWFAMAEQAIATAFNIHAEPEEWSRQLIAQMARGTFGVEESVCSQALSRFIFVLGHVAIKLVAHIETCERVLTQKRQAEAEGPEAPTSSKGGTADEDAEDDAISKELGGEAASDEATTDALLNLGEHLLDADQLLGVWAPLVLKVCSNEEGAFDSNLRSAAVLTLCKFMCTSAQFCDSNLRNLFTILAREQEPSIRSTAAIALGDIAVRHPNLLEPWTPRMYAQLHDSDTSVRNTVLMVLTHLILNDMVKVKGQVAEMAICLLDTEERIASLARLFFTEFSKKGSSPIYNLLPDILSSLSANSKIGEEEFRQIMGFLVPFISKDRQTETMVEKLCSRFGTSDAASHHRAVAYCIGVLPHGERSIRKLLDLSKTWYDLLVDDQVLESFKNISVKARKFASTGLKAALDDLQEKVKERDCDGTATQSCAPDASETALAQVPGEESSQVSHASDKTPKSGAKKATRRERRYIVAEVMEEKGDERNLDENYEASEKDENASANLPKVASKSKPVSKVKPARTTRSTRSNAVSA